MERFPPGKTVDDIVIHIISDTEYLLVVPKMENHTENIENIKL